jgi:hypothetical protein
MPRPKRRILWSGGVDSTYLLLSALQDGDRVEVAYAYMEDRCEWQKTRHEIQARHRIVHAIPAELRRRLLIAPREMDMDPEQSPWLWDACQRNLTAWESRGLTYSGQDVLLATFGAACGPYEAAYLAGERDFGGHDREVADTFRQAGIRLPLVGLSKIACAQDGQRRGFEHLLRLAWSCDDLDDRSTEPVLIKQDSLSAIWSTGRYDLQGGQWVWIWKNTNLVGPCGTCQKCRERVVPVALERTP